MINTLLSIVGYLFNWKIKVNNECKFLFESLILCRFQSIFLIHFLTARENLLYLSIIVYLYVLEKKFQKNISNKISFFMLFNTDYIIYILPYFCWLWGTRINLFK